jgi:hypothetical protein
MWTYGFILGNDHLLYVLKKKTAKFIEKIDLEDAKKNNVNFR